MTSRITLRGRESAHIHASDCVTWSTQGIDPALCLNAFNDEALAHYLSEVRPIYEQLKRVLGQISGLLILTQTTPARADRDQPMVTTAREQLTEARELWRTVYPPAAAKYHHAAFGGIAERLSAVLAAVDGRRFDLVTPDSHDLDTAMRHLFSAHGLLLAVSNDRAGMTPVNFSHACCCGAGKVQSSNTAE